MQEAENNWQRGDFAVAFAQYQSLLRERLLAGGCKSALATLTAADMVIIERTADLAILFGYTEAADNLLAGMMMLNQQAGNRYGADYIMLKRINLALQRGLLREADELLQTMSDIQAIRFTPAGLAHWESQPHWSGADQADRIVLLSRLYLVMGQLLASLGQYGDALAALERGLFHAGPTSPALAQQAALPLRVAIARAQVEKGELSAARASLFDLEPMLNENKSPGYWVRWLEVSGKMALLCGEFGTALAQFSRVRQICLQRGFHQAALRATLNLSHVLIYLNQTSMAKDYLLQIHTRAKQLGDEALMVRSAFLLGLAEARGHSLADGVPISPVSVMQGIVPDDTSKQEQDWDENPLDIPQSDNYLALFEERALTFHWLLGRRAWTAAADYLARLKQQFALSDSSLIRVRLRLLEGMLAYYQDNFDQAEAILQEIRPDLRDLDLKPELWQVQRILGWCWARVGRPDDEQHALAQETNTLLAKMTGSLSDTDQAIFLLNKWTAEEEYIAGEIAQLADMKRKLAVRSRLLKPWPHWAMMKRLHKLMQHIDRYKDTLAKRTVGDHEITVEKRRSVPLWRRLLTHPRDRITLSFLVLPDRVLVVREGWLSFDFGISPITRLQLRDLVRSWHKLQSGAPLFQRDEDRHIKMVCVPRKQAAKGGSIKESQEIASRLANALQIPALLSHLPEHIRALTIVPDDCLHGFPFAAIPYKSDEGKGKYLIERYALSFAFGRHEKHRVPPREGQALLVGVSKGTDKFVPLPGVAKELAKVSDWLANRPLKSCQLTDESASKSAILEQLPNSTLLHIACHGVFEGNQPDRSGIVLLANHKQPEVLTLRELSSVNLAGLKHVTLSSCWSADQLILPGRWIISLPETLWRAGTQSILGSLWKVNDKVAVAFMARFYSYLDDHPRDEALRRTQLDCLYGWLPECENLDTANIIHWAGFNLYGDYRWLKL